METNPDRQTIYASPGAKLAEALSKAQAEFTVPKKTKHVDFQPDRGARVKYSYADLADVIESIKAPLSKNGLAVTHLLTYADQMYVLKTLLVHSSGEFIETLYPLPDPKKENIRAQAFGSALTYARRYSLSALVGIAADEDDDGRGAPETTPPPGGKHSAPQQTPPQRPKNHAPGAQAPDPSSEDLNQALGDDEPGLTPLERLYQLAESQSIPAEEMKSTIERVIGVAKKSKDLSQDEVLKVIKYLELKTK